MFVCMHVFVFIHVFVSMRLQIYYFYVHNNMNELIDALSAYKDIPIFVKIVQEYDDEQYMPVPDYDYELEQLQKEINELEHKKTCVPEWDNIVETLKKWNPYNIPGIEGPNIDHVLRYTYDMDEQTTIDFINYCLNDNHIRLCVLTYHWSCFNHVFEYYIRTNKIDVFAHLIDNVLPDIYAYNDVKFYSFHDLLVITGIKFQSYTTLRWVIERYNISDSTLKYVNHEKFYNYCGRYQWSHQETKSIATLLGI